MLKFLIHCLAILFFIAFSIADSICQIKSLKWYSGNKSGISFVKPSPEILTDNPCNSQEGNVTITDEKGKLVLFACGNTIYNKELVPMKNGTGLFGNDNGSSAQSPLVLQAPGFDNLIYIFYVSEHVGNYVGDLRYSVINLCGDNGRGEVLISRKNIKLPGSYTERVTLVPIIHKESYWLVACSNESYTLNAFKIDKSGISLNPISSDLGLAGIPPQIGMINFNENYSKLAFTTTFNSSTGVFLANFNINTGKVSNFKNILSGNFYDVVFSYNDNYLYASHIYGVSSVVKYNLINQTNRIIYSVFGNYDLLAIEKGPDGNIYFGSATENCINRIINSNNENEILETSILCKSNASISQNANFFYGFTYESKVDTVVLYKCKDKSITYDGIVYEKTGEYDLESISEIACNKKIKLIIKEKLNPLTNLTYAICLGQSITINNQEYSNIGEYKQFLEDINGCDSTLVIKIIADKVDYKLNEYKKYLCSGSELDLNIQTVAENKIEWYKNGKVFSTLNNLKIIPNENDSISFKITSPNGCYNVEEISFKVIDLDKIVFSEDSLNICNSDSMNFDALNISGAAYMWEYNGKIIGINNNLKYLFNESGLLTLTIQVLDCEKKFKRKVDVKISDNIAFPNLEENICVGDTINLNAFKKLGISDIKFSFDDDFINTSSTFYLPQKSGVFNVQGLDKFGCLVNKNYTTVVVLSISPKFSVTYDYCSKKIFINSIDSFKNKFLNIVYDSDGNKLVLTNSDTIPFNEIGYFNIEKVYNSNLNCETRTKEVFIIKESNNNKGNYLPNIIKINSLTNGTFCPPDNTISISIYDRWGNLFFKGFNGENCWDGKFNQLPSAEGVYTYIINYIEEDCLNLIKVKVGDITVLH